MTQRKRLLAGLLVGALITGAAFAQKAGPHKRKLGPENRRTVMQTFERIDLNSDGSVVAEEWILHIKEFSFKKLDRNGNGNISRAEWDAHEKGADAAERFERWDSNDDGKLSKAEFRNTPRAKEVLMHLFRTVDRDGDRKLKVQEFIDRADAEE